MGRHHRDPAAALPQCLDLGRPVDRLPAKADRNHRPDQGADHRVAEGVRDDTPFDDPVGASGPGELDEGPHGRRPLTSFAEGGEVPQAHQQRTGPGHRVEVEVLAQPYSVPTSERVVSGRRVGDPVGVPPPYRCEPRVETCGCPADLMDHDVGGQQAAQPGQRCVLRRPVAASHDSEV